MQNVLLKFYIEWFYANLKICAEALFHNFAKKGATERATPQHGMVVSALSSAKRAHAEGVPWHSSTTRRVSARHARVCHQQQRWPASCGATPHVLLCERAPGA